MINGIANKTFENFDDYKIRRLQQGEKIESFDCGDADLNDFIINESHYGNLNCFSICKR